MDTNTKSYFDLCDYAYDTWKSYAISYIENTKPYWELLRK